MKTKVIILLLCATSICMQAQISVTKTSEVTPQYDRSKNQPDMDKVYSLKGQKLWVAPPLLQEHGYSNFFDMKADLSNYNTSTLVSLQKKHHYGKTAPKDPFGTRSEDLDGKTFIVDDVVYKGIGITYKREPIYVLMLTNTEKPKDKCQFLFEDTEYPFVTLSHYDYLKEAYPGKQFVVSPDYLMKVDADTGEQLAFSDTYYIVTFTDVTVYRSFIKLVCSIDNHKVLCGPKYDQLHYDGNEMSYLHLLFYSIEEWDHYIELYGLDNMEKVMSRNIKEGMPKELVLLAFGEPQTLSYIEDKVLLLNYKDISFVIGPENTVVSIHQKEENKER